MSVTTHNPGQVTRDICIGDTYHCRCKVFRVQAYNYPCTRSVSVYVDSQAYHLLYFMLSIDYVVLSNIICIFVINTISCALSDCMNGSTLLPVLAFASASGLLKVSHLT